MPDPVSILLVEDNPDDAALTELALRGGTPAHLEIARDGQEALDYLFDDANELPWLVLLDLRLPTIDGLEVLRRIRENARTRLTPVVILTNSSAASDVAAGYRAGANSYVCKPVDYDQFDPSARRVLAESQRAATECFRPVVVGPPMGYQPQHLFRALGSTDANSEPTSVGPHAARRPSTATSFLPGVGLSSSPSFAGVGPSVDGAGSLIVSQ